MKARHQEEKKRKICKAKRHEEEQMLFRVFCCGKEVTFNLDVLKNIQANVPITALIYFLSSIIFGFCFAYLGMNAGKQVGNLLRKED